MAQHVVVGGGVAGVCCAEELCRLCPADVVTLVSADRVLKGVSTVARITRILEEVKIEEKALDELPYPNLRLVQGVAAGVDLAGKKLLLGDGQALPYDKLAICAGAKPKQLTGVSPAAAASGRVLTLRDTDSVARLGAALGTARRVVVVGNGGIAMQLIHGLRGVEVVWAMKHGHIGDAFFDLDAAQFLLEELQRQRAAERRQKQEEEQNDRLGSIQPAGHEPGVEQQAPQTRQQQQAPSGGSEQRQPAHSIRASAGRPTAAQAAHMLGHAVGPHWLQQLPPGVVGSGAGGGVVLEYGCELAAVDAGDDQAPAEAGGAAAAAAQPAAAPQPQPGAKAAPGDEGSHAWPLLVRLTNGRELGADLVVAAIGVVPALDWVPGELVRGADGGLAVNRSMQTSNPDVYAAGDSCHAAWALEESPHWFQMRLWSQARSMGLYAAACMAGRAEDSAASMAFEMFTHVTRFLGKKVVLLGLYNGQRLECEPEEDMISYSRITEGATHHHGCCRPGHGHGHGEDEGRTFVRVLLLRGRVQGAVLIGETDLEETFENLILDQLDVGSYGPALLDPEVELDHVFD